MTTERKRHCIECGRPISLCNGFTLARDVVAALAGELPGEWVRELCGLCVLRRDLPELIAAGVAIPVDAPDILSE